MIPSAFIFLYILSYSRIYTTNERTRKNDDIAIRQKTNSSLIMCEGSPIISNKLESRITVQSFPHHIAPFKLLPL